MTVLYECIGDNDPTYSRQTGSKSTRKITGIMNRWAVCSAHTLPSQFTTVYKATCVTIHYTTPNLWYRYSLHYQRPSFQYSGPSMDPHNGNKKEQHQTAQSNDVWCSVCHFILNSYDYIWRGHSIIHNPDLNIEKNISSITNITFFSLQHTISDPLNNLI